MSFSRNNKKIAVIGGGVAGIATVAALRARGLRCIAFEKQLGPGGLWYNNYPGARNQTGGELYEFPDKQFPDELRDSARDVTAPEICAYLQAYIKEQGISECFRFGVEIIKIVRKAHDSWILHFKDGTTEAFSFVVVCSGLYSGNPNIIDLPGRHAFEEVGGRVIHTSQRKSDSEFNGKNVVVIGNGRSAIEAVLAAGQVAKENNGKPPVQLVRHAQWYFPQYLMGVIHFKYAFLSRSGGAMLPRYYFNDSALSKLLHAVAAPLKFVFWRMIEVVFILQHRLPWHMTPKIGTIMKEIFAPTSLIMKEYELQPYRDGDVIQRVATIDHLEPGKVVLTNGGTAECDVLVLGTGWKTSLGFLDQATVKSLLDLQDDGLWLYRHVLPPNAKGLAFVGSNASTFTNPNTAFIQACWLADLLAGYREWPSQENMLENAKKEKDFKRALYQPGAQRGASIFANLQHYHDLLLCDMGIDPMRYGGPLGTFCNWMLPVVPSDLKGAILDPDAREKARKLPAPAPLCVVAGVAAVAVALLYCKVQ